MDCLVDSNSRSKNLIRFEYSVGTSGLKNPDHVSFLEKKTKKEMVFNNGKMSYNTEEDRIQWDPQWKRK